MCRLDEWLCLSDRDGWDDEGLAIDRIVKVYDLGEMQILLVRINHL